MENTWFLEALKGYLQSRKRLPSVEEVTLPEGVTGRFEKSTAFGDGKLPPEGKIYLDKYSPQQEKTKALAHELTRAVDSALADQYFAIPRGDRGSDQFGAAYAKLVSGQVDKKLSPRQVLAAALTSRDNVERRGDYRASGAELWGFGGGSTVAPNADKLGNHVDPTMATEIAILLDLAGRKKP